MRAAREQVGSGRRWSLVLGLLLFGCAEIGDDGSATVALPALTPPSDGSFIPFRCGGVPAFDPQGDASGGDEMDIVGDTMYPAIYRYSDANYLYLRMRVDGNPASIPGDLNSKSWAFLIDTDDDFTSFEYLIHGNGVGDSVTWEKNDTQSPPNAPSDVSRTILSTYTPAVDYWHSKATGDGSAFGGDTDYFLTLAIRISDLQTAMVSVSDAVNVWAATSTNNSAFNVDLSCDDGGGTLNGQQTDEDALKPGCPDADNDGVCDALDPCPMDNPDDTDGDGVCDSSDPCPLDNPDDTDGDGVCDSNDPCPLDNPDDTDGDGVCDSNDPCPLDNPDDTDGDGVCDSNDPCPLDNPDDTDGDGVCDSNDTCAGGDDALDADSDGICDADDNCPQVFNDLQQDADGDMTGDACDVCPNDPADDVDSDGVCGDVDNCPEIANSDQQDSDGDGVGDACSSCGDRDQDGVCDVDDNCPDVPNPDQLDENDDGLGDACSCADDDRDGICNGNDNCPDHANPDQDDLDRDGTGDACDFDADGDGVADNLGVSGGGCSSVGGSADLPWLMALLVLLALLRPARRRLAGAGLVVVVLLAPFAARAQNEVTSTFSVERFRLTTTDNGLLNVEWGQVPAHLAWTVSAWIGNADDPLVVYDMTDPDHPRRGSIVDSRVGGAISASLALRNRVALGVTLPVVVYQSGDEISGVQMMSPLSSGGVGDAQLEAKVALLPEAGRTGLAVRAALSVPTAGSDTDFLGEDSVTFAPELILSHDFGRVRAAANIGLLVRDQARLGNLEVDDELYGRLGVGVSLTSQLELTGTLSQATSLSNPFQAKNQGVLDGLLGLNLATGGPVTVFVASGASANEGFGGADWRVLGGARLTSAGERDRDGDGVPDEDDQCPVVPEDRDGFQDRDGCPDDDNDGDGIADAIDGAPNDPEDRDGFEDQDGIPELDNDNDGIADDRDSCPNEPENLNGFQDDDGCPDVGDEDGDGIIGAADQCPHEPEDVDGFEDQNGCPDPDNDADGLLDGADACPTDAGPAENRGCPDRDRDGDTVVDRLDNCPDEPGSVANHGCKAKQLVQITPTKLVIVGSVLFASGKDVVRRRSFRLLDNVAAVMQSHPEIREVLVEGHTDDRGDDAFNMSLSQRRAEAVVAYLVKKGIESSRLRAQGFGEERPIESNAKSAGRAANRRVEFTIVASSVDTSAPAAPAVPATIPDAKAPAHEDAKASDKKASDKKASGKKATGKTTSDNKAVPAAGKSALALSPQDVIDKYESSTMALQRCYRKALENDPSLNVGRIEITVTVDTEGRASATIPGVSDLTMLICLQSTIRSWRFAKPPEPLRVQFTMMLDPNK